MTLFSHAPSRVDFSNRAAVPQALFPCAEFLPQARGLAPLVLRTQIASDAPARELLLDAALGAGRRAKTSELFRAGRLPAHGLALSATHGGDLVGTVRLWNVSAGGKPALLLGPLAVSGAHRSLGIGAALMEMAVERARILGHGAILLVGDAPYYQRFGFQPELTQSLDLPGPVERARFLALELAPGALAGATGMVVPTGARERSRPRTLIRQRVKSAQAA
jgi:predicted N-acetyltransferase YhbS